MAHRGHNEGSIYKRKDGKWMGQIQIGFKEDGSRKFITKTSKSHQEIVNWLASVRNDIVKSNFIEPSSITLEQWIWNWMVTYKLNNVSANSYARYLSLMKNHISPFIQNLKLQDVRSMHIQKIYNKLQDAGLGYTTIKHVHTVFNQSLEYAVRENLISKNFATYTVRHKPRNNKEVEVFTKDQQKTIIENLPDSPLGMLIRMGLNTGCRLGELLGLKWENVDFKNKVIHIRTGLIREQQFSEDGKELIGYKLVVGGLKTPKSKRDIPITDSLIKELQKYKLKQKNYIHDPDSVPKMVFLSSAGTYWDEINARKVYAKYLKSIGVPYIKFHALRHTFATRIMEANVHPKVAQELLGHSTVSITMDVYSHVLPEQKIEAINKIKDII